MMRIQRANPHLAPLSAALTAALLLAAPAGASPARVGAGAKARPASACAALFGADATRASNARARARIDWIDQDEDGVTIAHTHGSWDEPAALTIRGVHLQAVEGASAEVSLDPSTAAALGCLAGRYSLRADDSIGRWSRILAVLQQGVLVEHRGRLRYIRAPRSASPRFVMGWHLPGELRPDPSPMIAPYQSPHIRYRTARLSGLSIE